jgi:hypothetical protein
LIAVAVVGLAIAHALGVVSALAGAVAVALTSAIRTGAHAVAIQVPVAGAVVVARLVHAPQVLDHAVHDLNRNGQFRFSWVESRGQEQPVARLWRMNLLIYFLSGGGHPLDVDSFLGVVVSTPVCGGVVGFQNFIALPVEVLHVGRQSHDYLVVFKNNEVLKK